MSNELSLDDWGDLAFEMATFKKYHTYLYNEFAHRHLPVYLLATDASPMERWETVEWAIANGSDFQRIWRTSLCKRLRSGGSGFL